MIHELGDKVDQTALVQQLFDNKCLKFGDFTLKSGDLSKYYIDLRESTYNPRLFHCLVEAVKNVIPKDRHSANQGWTAVPDKKTAIVGVPYGVVPLAAAVAYELKLPYFPVRKETKDYGNKQALGSLDDHKFILIEDVMSTGSSILETLKKLEGKTVTDVIVIADREAGGVRNIQSVFPNIKVTAILKASQLLGMKGRMASEENERIPETHH